MYKEKASFSVRIRWMLRQKLYKTAESFFKTLQNKSTLLFEFYKTNTNPFQKKQNKFTKAPYNTAVFDKGESLHEPNDFEAYRKAV